MCDNGLRADRMFDAANMAVMHAYPIYQNLGRGARRRRGALRDGPDRPLGQADALEEFGACTAPPGQPTTTWEWQAFGSTWTQVMLSEEVLAEHLEQVLPRLAEVGATARSCGATPIRRGALGRATLRQAPRAPFRACPTWTARSSPTPEVVASSPAMPVIEDPRHALASSRSTPRRCIAARLTR